MQRTQGEPAASLEPSEVAADTVTAAARAEAGHLAAAGEPVAVELGRQSGSCVALDHAFRAYARQVATLALRLLGRPDEVDDVVQDVFVRAARALPRIRDLGALRTWLTTVTVRVVRSRLRARRLRSFVGLDESVAYEGLINHQASPEERALLGSVYRRLDRLPVDVRVPWTLRYLQGEDLEAIARLCGCSLATVKRRLAAAQQRLKGSIVDE